MNEERFWEIISLFDWNESGDDEAVLAPAVSALMQHTKSEIFAFAELIAEKLHAIDTREHCRHCYEGEVDPDDGDDYISADDFLYSRCVVVANGEAYFRKVLRDPTEMPQGLEFEALLGLAAEAFEQKTGEEYDYVCKTDYESFQNRDGWAPTQRTKAGKFTDKNIPPGNRRLH